MGAGAALDTERAVESARVNAMKDSEALKLTCQIYRNWSSDFEKSTIRPVRDVVPLLERLEDHPPFKGKEKEQKAKDTIHKKSLVVFRCHPPVDQKVLVLISDEDSTDGDPLPLAVHMKEEKVAIAGIFLTDDNTLSRRQLHDTPPKGWSKGVQRTLFNMASRVSVLKHPIPVLASVGWKVAPSGKCGSYATIHSADALEEFCSILLSAQFGSADVLLDLVG